MPDVSHNDPTSSYTSSDCHVRIDTIPQEIFEYCERAGMTIVELQQTIKERISNIAFDFALRVGWYSSAEKYLEASPILVGATDQLRFQMSLSVPMVQLSAKNSPESSKRGLNYRNDGYPKYLDVAFFGNTLRTECCIAVDEYFERLSKSLQEEHKRERRAALLRDS